MLGSWPQEKQNQTQAKWNLIHEINYHNFRALHTIVCVSIIPELIHFVILSNFHGFLISVAKSKAISRPWSGPDPALDWQPQDRPHHTCDVIGFRARGERPLCRIYSRHTLRFQILH